MENNSYSNESNNTNDSEDIDNMVLEVSNVLRNHLVNIFKNIKDDSATLEILNQLPMVKKMNENVSRADRINISKLILNNF